MRKPIPHIFQTSSGWDLRYTFSGKEKDSETGYSYPSTGSVQRFGASPDSCTGYDSDISVWLSDAITDRSVSMDPLAFKYPHESPYSYVGNRPINTIDPWGMDKVEDPNGNKGEAGDYKQTSDKKYLYGDDLKPKVWDSNYEGGGNRADGTQKGGYVDYEGPDIDFNTYNSKKAYSFNSAIGNYNYNKTYFGSRGQVSFIDVSAHYDMNYGYMDFLAYHSTLNADVNVRFGNANYNFTLAAQAEVVSAGANFNAGVATGQGGKTGLICDANAGAYTAKGELNGSITIRGITIRGTVGGSVLSAHAGVTGGIFYDVNTQSIEFKGLEHAGLGLGQKLGISISIPISYFDW